MPGVERWRNVGLAALSGCILAVAHHSPRWSWLMWASFCPLLLAVRHAPMGTRLVLGLTTGVVWTFLETHPWLRDAIRQNSHAGPIQVSLLGIAACLYMSGFLVMGYALVYPWLPSPKWLSAPAVWILLEWVETNVLHSPMVMLGHSQYDNVLLTQSAELTGVAGLSFVLMMSSVALVELGSGRVLGLAVVGVMVLVMVGFGWMRVHQNRQPEGRFWLVHVVSGENGSVYPTEKYAARTDGGADLTVWPEEATGEVFLDEHPDLKRLVAETARAHGWLLAGVLRLSYSEAGVQQFLNSALLWDPGGHVAGHYDKHWLVPGLEDTLLGRRAFTAGRVSAVPLRAGPLRVGPLICWESMFAEPALGYARDGVDVLVNVTGDRTVGVGAMDHLAITRFRAIETRTWLVRASGIHASLVIDPAGEVRRADWVRVDRHTSGPTFYARHPYAVVQVAVVLLAALSLVASGRA